MSLAKPRVPENRAAKAAFKKLFNSLNSDRLEEDMWEDFSVEDAFMAGWRAAFERLSKGHPHDDP